MNHLNHKSAQKTAELIDLDQTYPPQQQIQISQLLHENEGQAALSDVDEEIMIVSGHQLEMNIQEDGCGEYNNNLSEQPQNNIPSQPLQSIENVPENTAKLNNKNPQYYYFNYQQNLPQKNTGSSGVSEQKTVDTLIIGGGPASLGLLVNAVKTNRLTELLQGDGLAIIDAGLNFGGGILGRYGINSNTSGGGFLKCTYKKTKKDKNSEAKASNQEDEANKKGKKPDGKVSLAGVGNINGKTIKAQKTSSANDGCFQNPYAQQFAQSSKNMMVQSLQGEQTLLPSNDIMAPYKELYNSNISRILKDFGKNTAPLAVIGHFLNYSGNHLLSFIHQTTKKKIFYPLHKAVSIQLMSNGEILTKVKRQQLEISVTDDSESLKIIETDQVVVFRSRMIVISNGGVQGLHPELFNWFPTLDPSKVVASDEFLRSATYMRQIANLKQKKTRKIVIIGGSHSGFSCAWMLLNGPASYYNNNAGIQISKEPYAQRKSVKNCFDCCQCGSVLQNLKKQKAQMNQQNNGQNVISPNKLPDKQKDTSSSSAPQSCNCLCICFGLFDYDDWKFNFSQLPDYSEGDIEILYREQIKVFYNKVSDAEKDGYDQFEQDKFSKKDGYLYSFSGLRGDAKDLYLKIMRGQEKRVRMVQAKTVEEQRKYVEKGDLVIWACGYQTNSIPIKDTDRKRLQLSQKVPNTQYDVDGKCRIMLADGHVLAKTFACGIAYPVRTKDGMLVNNPQVNNPRADGFSLYMNFVGDTILKNIIPKSKMIKSTVHKIMPKNKMTNEAQSAAQNAGQNQNENLSKKQYQQVLRARIQQYRQKNENGTDPAIPEGNVLEKQRAIRNKSVNAPPGIRSSSAAPGQSDDQFSGGNIEQRVILNINDDDEDEYEKQQRFEFDEEDETNAQDQKMSLRIQQINAIKRQSNQIQGGTKSVDRGQIFKANGAVMQVPPVVNGGGVFHNKFSQMARSPQILQRKQENILKMQAKQGLGDLNSDIALLMTPEGPSVENQQVLAASRQLKSRKMRGINNNNPDANQARLVNPQIQSKSPYNQNLKSGALKSHLDGSGGGGGGSAQLSKNQGVGREILKSSQGANRKLDMILAMQQQKDIGGGSFKVGPNHRQSQVSFNGKQRNKQGSIHQNGESSGNGGGVFGSNMYNSLGSGQQQTIQEINQRSSRQGTYDQRRHGGVELPPILHPLAQNHYVYMGDQLNDLSSINLNQTGIATQELNNSNDNSNINLNLLHQNSELNKSSQSRLFKQQLPTSHILPSDINSMDKRPNGQGLKGVSSFENNKTMRSSSIYCLQANDNPEKQLDSHLANSTLTVHSKARNLQGSQVQTLIPSAHAHSLLPPPSQRERPLSDQRSDEPIPPIRVVDCQELPLRVKNKLSPTKKGGQDEAIPQEYNEDVNMHATEDDEYGIAATSHSQPTKKHGKKGAQSPPPQRQQRILSNETNESQFGYENDKFENENLHKNLDSQEAEDEDGIDEDVSSEGSCRTSLYQVSVKGQDESEGLEQNAAQILGVSKAKSQNHEGGSSKNTNSELTRSQASAEMSSQNGNKKDNISSKFSFQSRIPRLSKPNQNQFAGVLASSKPHENSQVSQVIEDYQLAHNGTQKPKIIKQMNGGGSHSPAIGEAGQNTAMSKKLSVPVTNEHSANKPHNRFGFSHNERKLLGNKNTQVQVNGGVLNTPLESSHHQPVLVTNQDLLASMSNVGGGGASSSGFNRQQQHDLKTTHSNPGSSQQLHRRNTLNPQNSNKQANNAPGNAMQTQLHNNNGHIMIQERGMISSKQNGKTNNAGIGREASKKTNETKAQANNKL